jgi:hypothetical protein
MQANITIIYMDSEISMGEADGENAILDAWEEALSGYPEMYAGLEMDCKVSVVIEGKRKEMTYWDALTSIC